MAPRRDASPDSSDLEGDGDGIFDGVLFWVEGPIVGYTIGRIHRLVQENGGKIAKKLDQMPSHFILSPQLWAREGTPGPSLLIKGIKAANEEIKTEEDPDNDRAWMLQPEWLINSVKKGEMLAEAEYDYERIRDTARENNKKAVDLERRRNGGKSKYARGERRTLKLEQQRTKAVAEAEKEIAQEKKEREQAVQAAFGAVPSQEKGGALVDSRLLKSAAEQQPQPKVAPAKTKLVDLSPQEFRKRAADAAAKRQEESKAKGQDDEPDIYDQMSKKVRGQPKPAAKAKAKASDMLRPGKPSKTGKPPRIVDDDSSDEEPLKIVKKRKTFN